MFNKFKIFGKTLTLAAAAFVSVTAPAMVFARTERGFTIQNSNATVAVQRIWTKRTGVLGGQWVETALKFPIGPKTLSTFTLGGTACLYDIRVSFADGEEQDFDSINVCRGQSITVT